MSTAVATSLPRLRTRLFGLETEYAFAALSAAGVRLPSNMALPHLMEAVKGMIPSLPDRRAHLGMFLANGARLYVDCGHPELATAEVTHPADLCRHVLAGDELLKAAGAAAIRGANAIHSIFLGRSNIGYGRFGTTWGCHESYGYTNSANEIRQLLIPHFVSRIIYTGAGGFDNQSPGLRFLVSPRVAQLRKAVSERSTADRGIFHTKFEPLNSAGQYRLHVICGEGLRSHRAMWLKAATTALLLALFDAGAAGTRRNELLTLADPVEAMRAFSADPTGHVQAPMAESGTRMTALEIQRSYLELVERHAGDAILPDWAPLACRRWREVLERLEHGPSALARTLDWAVKRALFHQHAERRAVPPSTWPVWTEIFTSLQLSLNQAAELNETLVPLITPDLLLPDHPIAGRVRELTPLLKRHDLDWSQLEHVLQVRQELFALDTRYSEIGGASLFETMDRAGVLEHACDDVDDVASAVATPPSGGRAEIRGREIVRLSNEQRLRAAGNPVTTLSRASILADWDGIWDYGRAKVLNLEDPFETEVRWRDMTHEEKFENHGSALPLVTRMLTQILERYDQGRYEDAAQVLGQLNRVRHILSVAQRRDYCRFSAWVQARRGFLDSQAALREVVNDDTEDLSQIGDVVCALRYQGLCPPSSVEPWIVRSERLMAANEAADATSIPLLGHIGYHRLRQGKPRKALASLQAARRRPQFESAHAHVRSRILADMGDAFRMLGWKSRATAALAEAETIQREQGFEGDRADATLTYRAKLADSPSAAAESLAEALAIQTRLGNRVGEARSLLIEARTSTDPARHRAIRTRLVTLRRELPALKRCRLMRTIARNWRAWIAGENILRHRDRFWCL